MDPTYFQKIPHQIKPFKHTIQTRGQDPATCHNLHFIIQRGTIFNHVIDSHIILNFIITNEPFFLHASSFHCVSIFSVVVFRSESFAFIAMNGNEAMEDVTVVEEEEKSSEKMVYMWGYLPGASSEKAPILSPTPVRLTDSSFAGDSWKDVCGGGCGFAVAISG